MPAKHIRSSLNRVLSVWLALMLLLAACGGGDGDAEGAEGEAAAQDSQGQADAPADEAGGTVEFWTQSYGDPAAWNSLIEELAAEFQDETGIAVNVEVIQDFQQGRERWLLVSQGAEAPDAADMFQLYTYAQLGGEENGPMPITEYRDEYWPDLGERFFPSLLSDAEWEGEFYGIPWRTDSRPFIYRTDFAEEAGLSGPPDTWDEQREYAIALTDHEQGRYGLAFGGDVLQGLMPILWQAGGEFMTEDGKTATIDTPEMRTALEYLDSLFNEHQVVSPDYISTSYDPISAFINGDVAMLNGIGADDINLIARDYPELDGKWEAALVPKGPVDRSSYMGGGYWGLLRGTQNVEGALTWLQFLTRDENMQRISETTGTVSTNRAVMNSEFWSDEPWKRVVTENLDHGHTSQMPSPFWTIIRDETPNSPLWQMYEAALVTQQPLDDVLANAQEAIQQELNRGLEEFGQE